MSSSHKISGSGASRDDEAMYSPMGSARSTADGGESGVSAASNNNDINREPVPPPPSALPPPSLLSPRSAAKANDNSNNNAGRVPYPTIAGQQQEATSPSSLTAAVVDGGAGSNPAPAFDDSNVEAGAPSAASAAAVAAAVAAAAAAASVAEGDARATPPLASVPTSEVPNLLFRRHTSDSREEQAQQPQQAQRQQEEIDKTKKGQQQQQQQQQQKIPPNGIGRGKLGYRYIRERRASVVGWALMLLWLAALAFYVYVRVAFTLEGLGKVLPYGILVLVFELLGATTIAIYGLNLLFVPIHEKFTVDESYGKSLTPPASPAAGVAPPNFDMPKVALPYHVRVLIPCYKEDLDVCRQTVLAAAAAPLPAGCKRTVYLCDDGKDKEKREFIKNLGDPTQFVYVSGRQRKKGEMNGKSANLNNVCAQLYPEGVVIPGNELICVFDADQVATSRFFAKTIPLFDGGDDVAMVLSPQCFHNLDLHCDVFNHSNIHFWEYAQPGYDALGFISCTGTNFLIRAAAFRDAGWSPEYTLTEDFALGMELKKRGWHCRYVQEYLAIGEAPDQVRNCFQQRSRWTKGHFQIIFNPLRNPLFQRGLPLFDRLMYCSGTWCYFVGALSTPLLAAVPLVTIWVGFFPLVVTRELALALTLYAAATQALLYNVRTPRHLEPLWFANVANQILWWAYIKAAWRMLWARVFFCFSRVTFKATAKGKGKLATSIIGDVWLHALFFTLLAVSIGVAVWQLVAGADPLSPLLISVLWATYAAVPPALLLLYALLGPGLALAIACKFSMLLSTSASIAAVGLLWAIKDFKPQQGAGGIINSQTIGLVFRNFGKKVSQTLAPPPTG